jgi:hypothetical protein
MRRYVLLQADGNKNHFCSKNKKLKIKDMLNKQMRELERHAQVTMKERLNNLLNLPKHQFDAVIKLINPKLTNEDLKPMFPKEWSADSNWPEFKYDYDSFRKIQIEIDDYAERMVGC